MSYSATPTIVVRRDHVEYGSSVGPSEKEVRALLLLFGFTNALVQVGLIRQLAATHALTSLRAASNIIIGLSLLSLGLGAWLTRYIRHPANIRRAAIANTLFILLSLGFVLRLAPNMSASVADLGALLRIAAPLSLPLVAMGFATARLYGRALERDPDHIGTAVAASSFGFAAGYVLSPHLATLLGVNTMFILSALLSIVAALGRPAAIVLVCLPLLVPMEGAIEDLRIVDPVFWPAGDGEHLHAGWSPYHKLDLYAFRGKCLTGMYNFRQQMMTCPEPSMDIPFRRTLYMGLGTDRRVLIIGAGGGMGALSFEDARDLAIVELDPGVVDLMSGPFAAFNGGLYQRISPHAMDGRAYLDATRQLFDLIIYEGTDYTVTAVPRSPVEVENYLYTREGLGMALERLAPGGSILMINVASLPQTARIVTALRDLRATTSVWEVEIDHPLEFSAHFILSSQDPKAVALLDERVRNTGGARIRLLDKISSERAITDDRPFLYLDSVDELAPLVWLIVTLSGLALVYVLASGNGFMAYFLVLGNAFILTELYTIVRFRSFLGDPVSTTAVVTAFLLSTAAAGSVLSPRFQHRKRSVLVLAVACAFVHAALGIDHLPSAPWGYPIRLAYAFLTTAPLGFLLGVFFPLGLRRIDPNQTGSAYMLDAVGTVTGLFAFHWLAAMAGFKVTGATAFSLYMSAVWLLKR